MKCTSCKKRFALFLAAILLAGCFSGCDMLPFNKGDATSSSIENENEERTFTSIYKGRQTVKLATKQTTEIAINQEIGEQNYFKIELLSDVNLVGYIHYAAVDKAATTHKEKMYIEQGTSEFTMFLDAFRKGAFGNFAKKIEKITLQNVSGQEGNVRVTEVSVSNRTYDNQKTLYINNGKLKLGASLAAGGAICHLEKMDENVVEYLDGEGNVRIDKNVDASKVKVVSKEVNLINVHDLGREIQQSYYAIVDESHGYAPKDEVLYEGAVLYNPVQAGSAGDKQSQIIDYRCTDTEIYVKIRPQDWFFDNTQTDSYMENIYKFGENGVLMVYNRFVNFSQFTDMEKAQISSQETPAVYTVYPLNYFYCETQSGVILDPNLSSMMTSNKKTDLNDFVNEPYYYMMSQEKVPDDWFAFVNDKNFGVGIYVPNSDFYGASRGWASTAYDMIHNHSYNKEFHYVPRGEYVPSAYAVNYNYCSAPVIRRMVDFVPFEYEYAICVGTVDEMRGNFLCLKEAGTIQNEGLNAWENA